MMAYANSKIAAGRRYPLNSKRDAAMELVKWVRSTSIPPPSFEEKVSMVWEDLDRFLEIRETKPGRFSVLWRTPFLKEKCLKCIPIAYRNCLCIFSPEEAKSAILERVELWFWEHDKLREWSVRVGASPAFIRQSVHLISIWKDFVSVFQQRLDQAELEVQRERLAKRGVTNVTREAPAPEQRAPASVPSGGAEVPREQGNVIAYMGATWKITSEGKEGTMRDCRGVRFLALLLQSPGESFHAKELQALAVGKRPEGTDLESADPFMDKTAKNKLKLELERLKLERASAHDEGDDYELVRIDQEFDRLAEEARRISHPKACYSSGTEKARKNVSNQVAQTIRDLAEIPGLRPLSKHLKNSIKKGKFLSYQGGLRWAVELPPAKKSAA